MTEILNAKNRYVYRYDPIPLSCFKGKNCSYKTVRYARDLKSSIEKDTKKFIRGKLLNRIKTISYYNYKPYQKIQKSWKTQCKCKKQWQKNVVLHTQNIYV